jgi:ABC-type transporter lipoprotein component MlaA
MNRFLFVVFFLLIEVSSMCISPVKADSHNIYNEEYYGNEEDNSQKNLINDPFETFNRKMLDFNMFVLDNIANPFLRGYKTIVPKLIRKMINNLSERIKDIPTFMYSAGILDYKNSLKTVGVFGLNMTIGIFGLFDPASNIGLTRRQTNLGDVFGYYNIGSGFYLVLPIVGPTTLTDGLGSIGNFYLNPLDYNGLELGKTAYSWTPRDVVIPKYFVEYIRNVESANSLNENFIKKSFEPYSFVKKSFVENKNYRISILKNKR